MKNKLYWWIQQINRIGGTEMVSIDLANSLINHYDITFISTVNTDGDIPYEMDNRIKLISLNIPKRCEQYEYLSKKYLSHFRIFSYLFLVLQIFFYYVLKRGSYRRRIEKMIMEEDATLICSSVDTYMLSPKKGRVFFHYHFDSKTYFGRDNFFIKHSRKPDKWIFLSNTTRNEILEKKPELKECSTFIYNPIRYDSILNTDYHDNTMVFIGRYAEQKNPLLALAIAKELKDRNFSFKLKMYGDGPLTHDVHAYYDEHHLEDVVEINDFAKNVKEILLNADALLMTSRYEGFSLVMSEANAMSRPWILTNHGNTLRERVIPWKNGVVIDGEDPRDFADVIIKMFSDKNKLKEMKIGSFEESKKLSKEVIVPKWISLIEN